MAQQATLQATIRTTSGKGAARATRRAGKIPAIIYGHKREPEQLAVDSPTFLKLLGTIAAASTIVDVAVDGRPPVKALIREIQRDPLKSTNILHVDFFEIRADEKVTLEVPIHLVGTPDGVRNFGGVLDQVMHRIQIRVFPADIPERVEVDVNDLAIGHSIFVRDMTIPNAEIMGDMDRPVASVVAPRTEEAPAPGTETVAPAEPELIRKPKAEGEEEAEGKE